MTLFSRLKLASGGKPAPAESADPPPKRRQHSVGELLRETRRSLNGDSESIAAQLRIRPEYLVAIEESRYDDLPGVVYAQGFVRAYAVHLGLDGEEAVRRFKLETSGLDKPRDLAFPMPLSQRSIPGGSMLLTAVILVLCGYGVYFYIAGGQRARPERVAPIPAELAPLAPEPARPAGVAPTTSAAAAAPSAAPAPTESAPAAASTDAVPPSVAAVTSAPAPAQVPAAAPPLAAATPSPAPPTLPAARPAAAPAPSAAPPAPSAAPPAATPAAAPADAPSQPKVYGTDGPARIVIRVLRESWVEVRAADSTVLLTRLLKPGDVYRVPSGPGLVMRTGNASGLDITVDGRSVPPLGGAFRRNVVLDPDRLLAGKAVE